MKKLLASTAAAAVLVAAGSAFAADLPSRKGPPPQPYVAVPVFTWTGLYVGANAGYGFGNYRSSGFVNPYNDPKGFVGGGQIGYNYQIGQFVIGAETDLQYADLKSTGGVAPFLGTTSRLDYFGTVRARAGVAFDRFLVYATGGYAYGHVKQSGFLAAPFVGVSNSASRNGWTVGGGVEYAFTQNWTGKVEYLYTSLEKKNVAGIAGAKLGNDFSVVRAGLNYKF